MQQPLVVASAYQYRPPAVGSRVASTPGDSKRSDAAQAPQDQATALAGALHLAAATGAVSGHLVEAALCPVAVVPPRVGRHTADLLCLTTAVAQ